MTTSGWQPVVKVARPLLASSGRALRCRDLPVFSCNTAASRRLDPGPMPRRNGSRDFNHGLLGGIGDCPEWGRRFSVFSFQWEGPSENRKLKTEN